MADRAASARISVIIPTHNRSASLRRTLDALCAQSHPPAEAEVVVVADGCTDDTMEMVRRYDAPFPLHLLEQPESGPAAARNRGARHATGQLLVFLDDDIEPSPHLVQAHARACRTGNEVVSIGYLPAVLETQTKLDRIDLLNWWEAMFDAMRVPGRRFLYSDLLGGNFALSAQLFEKVGGFDPDFRCHEDYELGFRLLEAGASFTFSPEAWGGHHERSAFVRVLERKFEEGKADVMIARRHPELRPVLLAASVAHTRQGGRPNLVWLTVRVAFVWPRLGDALLPAVVKAAALAHRAGLRRGPRRLRIAAMRYWYARGVAEEVASEASLADLMLANPSSVPPVARVDARRALELYFQAVPDRGQEVTVDLSGGLPEAERQLDALRPAAVRIRYRGSFIGRIPSRPGTERIRGSHLRPILATVLADALYRALEAEGALEAEPGQQVVPLRFDVITPPLNPV